MTIKLIKNIMSLKTGLIVGVVAVALASCGGLKNPLSPEEVAKINASFSFEDQDLEKGSIGGPLTIDIPKASYDKIVGVKEVTHLDVFISQDIMPKSFIGEYFITSIPVQDVVAGLNSLGTVASGTSYEVGDKFILALSSVDEDEGNEKKTIATGVFTAASDNVGTEASASDVTAVITEEIASEFVDSDVVDFDNVQFEFDKAIVSNSYKNKLSSEVNALNADLDKLRVQISGHCDARGTQEYNLALGERRAAAVRSYLISLGILGSNIFTVSFGEEQPLDIAETEEAWAKNRRAEVKVVVKK